MIEETIATLMNYGVLGAWTGWLLYEKSKLLGRVEHIIMRNTEAIDDLREFLEIKKKR